MKAALSFLFVIVSMGARAELEPPQPAPEPVPAVESTQAAAEESAAIEVRSRGWNIRGIDAVLAQAKKDKKQVVVAFGWKGCHICETLRKSVYGKKVLLDSLQDQAILYYADMTPREEGDEFLSTYKSNQKFYRASYQQLTGKERVSFEIPQIMFVDPADEKPRVYAQHYPSGAEKPVTLVQIAVLERAVDALKNLKQDEDPKEALKPVQALLKSALALDEKGELAEPLKETLAEVEKFFD